MDVVEGGDGLGDGGFAFAAEDHFPGIVRRGGPVQPPSVFIGAHDEGLAQDLGGAGASFALVQGRIHPDAIEPSVERTVTPEGGQLDIRLNQCLLDDVAGVLGVANHVEDRVEQPVLILQDQLSEGLRLPLEGQVDQLGVVAHSRLNI